MNIFKRFLIWVDFGLNTLRGGYPGETVSACLYRNQYTKSMKIVNTLFFNPNHCRDAYMAVKSGQYLPPEYKESNAPLHD